MGDPGAGPGAPVALTWRRAAMQIAGFLAGLALLGWIAHRAASEGQWHRLAEAPPAALALLLGCSVVSAALNGSIFWVTVRPIARLSWWDLQKLNLVASMLNYAPLRLGAIARVYYHLRVDRLGLLEIGAWFALVGYLLVLGVASCGLATVARPSVDWLWALLVVAQMALGAAALRAAAGLPLLASRARGIERLARDTAALAGGAALRLADLGAFTGRMAAAAWILGIDLALADTVMLALVALLGGLIPVGRLGFREFCVRQAAEFLMLSAGEVEARTAQLALIESAGEAAVCLPLGAACLLWLRARLRAAKKK